MEFGVSALIFGQDDIIPHLSLLAQYNIKHIELRVYPPRIPYNDKEYIKKLRHALEKNNISVHSFHLPFNNIDISSQYPEKRQSSIDEISGSLDICRELGSKLGILHPGAKYNKNKEAAEEHSLDSIIKIFEKCEKYNIKLAVENMLPGRIGEDFVFFEKIFTKIRSSLIGICYDSSHANVNGTVYDFLKKSNNKLLTVHLSDNNGLNDEHLFPFEGNIIWTRIFKILANISYESIFMLEVAVHEGLTDEQHLKNYQEVIDKISQLVKKSVL